MKTKSEQNHKKMFKLNRKSKGCIALVLICGIGTYATYQWTEIATATNYAELISTIKKSNIVSLSNTTTNYGLFHSNTRSIFKVFPDQLLGKKSIPSEPIMISMTTNINSINPFKVKSKTTFKWIGVTARQLIDDLSYSDISFKNNGKLLEVVSSNNEINLPFELNTEDCISMLHGSTSSLSFKFYDIHYVNNLAKLTKFDLAGASINFTTNTKHGYDNSLLLNHADIEIDKQSLVKIDNFKVKFKESVNSKHSNISLSNSNLAVNFSILGLPIANAQLSDADFEYSSKANSNSRTTYNANFSAVKLSTLNAPLGLDQLSNIKWNGQLQNVDNDTLATTIDYLTSPRSKNQHTLDSLITHSPFTMANEPILNGSTFKTSFDATTSTGNVEAKWTMDVNKNFLNIAMNDHTAFLKGFSSVVSIAAPMNVAKQFVPFSDLMELNKQNKLMISDHNGNKSIKGLISYKNGKITYSK